MACYLVKIDASKNQRRFYNLHLAPTLFGGWSLVREWGRLGSGGTVRFDSFVTEHAAQSELETIKKSKMKGGYISVNQ